MFPNPRPKWGASRAFLAQEFFASLAFALAFTAQAVFLVQDLALTPVQLVLIGTVLELSCFLLEIPTGVVADVYSRRASVVLGFAFLGLSFVIVALGGAFGWVLAAQVVAGLGYTCLSGAQSAWLADEVGEDRLGAALLRGAQVGRVGGLVGLAGAALLGSLALSFPILLGGAVMLGLAGLLALRMPETNFERGRFEGGAAWRGLGETFLGGVRVVRTRPTLLALVGAAVVYGASTEALDRLWQLHLLQSFALPDLFGLTPVAWFSVVGVLGTVLGLAVTEGARRRLDTQDPARLRRALLALGSLGTAAVLGFAFAGRFDLALAAFLAFGVLRGLYEPLYGAWLNRGLEPRTRATVLSIASQADALGQVAGGPGVGFVGNVFGVRSALGVSALLRLPVLLVLVLLARGEMKNTSSPASS